MKQDNEKSGTGAIRKEVEGQFARSKHGRKNDGVANAAPKTITGSEDATFDTDPKDKPLGTAKKKASAMPTKWPIDGS